MELSANILAGIDNYSKEWQRDTFTKERANDDTETKQIKQFLNACLHLEFIEDVHGSMEFEEIQNIEATINQVTQRQRNRFTKHITATFEAAVLPLLANTGNHTNEIEKCKIEGYNRYTPNPHRPERIPVQITHYLVTLVSEDPKGANLETPLYPGVYWLDNIPYPRKLWESCLSEMIDIYQREKAGDKKIKAKGYTAKDYALAYALDQYVAGNNIYQNTMKQKELEAYLWEYSKNNKSGSAIRKAFDRIKNAGDTDLLNPMKLLSKYGEEWKDKVLAITKQPDLMREYLDEKKL